MSSTCVLCAPETWLQACPQSPAASSQSAQAWQVGARQACTGVKLRGGVCYTGHAAYMLLQRLRVPMAFGTAFLGAAVLMLSCCSLQVVSLRARRCLALEAFRWIGHLTDAATDALVLSGGRAPAFQARIHPLRHPVAPPLRMG